MAKIGIIAPVKAQPVNPINSHGHSGRLTLSKSLMPTFSNFD